MIAADRGERQHGDDQRREPQAVEEQEKQEEDRRDRDRHDDHQVARARAAGSRTARPTRGSSPRAASPAHATFCCSSATKPPRSRPLTLMPTTMRRLAVSRLICAGPSTTSIFARLSSGTIAPCAGGDRDAADLGDAVAQALGQPHHRGEAPLALVDLGRALAADRRLDGIVDVGRVQSHARDRLPVDRDGEILLAGDPVDPEIAHAAHAGGDARDLVGLLTSGSRDRRRRSSPRCRRVRRSPFRRRGRRSAAPSRAARRGCLELLADRRGDVVLRPAARPLARAA